MLAAGPSPSPTSSPSPSPSPSTTVSSDVASALPSWLLITLAALVAFIVLAMFALAAYNLSAPRAPLKRLLKKPGVNVPSSVIGDLASSARPGKRTTRTILAIAGFALLGVAVIAAFGLSGQGVRDLRSQIVAAITTLVAAISGFYFGTRAAQSSAGGSATSGTAAAPTVTEVSPPSGPAAGGKTVTLIGTGFIGATSVNFGQVAGQNPAIASDTQLTVTSPRGTVGATVHVTVTSPAGTSPTTLRNQFTYT